VQKRITQAPFGKTPGGATASLYTLSNAGGMLVNITDLGAVITAVCIPDRYGLQANVVRGIAGETRWSSQVDGDRLLLRHSSTASTLSYQLNEGNELVLRSHAATSAQGICFNLAGEGDILGHELTIAAGAFAAIDSMGNATGVLTPVAGTPFDFRTPRCIGERIGLPDKQLRHGGGYGHCFVLNKPEAGALAFAARLRDPLSGRVLELLTSAPVLRLRSGVTGNGVCLEPLHENETESRYRFSSE